MMGALFFPGIPFLLIMSLMLGRFGISLDVSPRLSQAPSDITFTLRSGFDTPFYACIKWDDEGETGDYGEACWTPRGYTEQKTIRHLSPGEYKAVAWADADGNKRYWSNPVYFEVR